MGRPPVCAAIFSERAIKLPRNGTIEETPGYCKAEDLARLLTLSAQSISQLTRDGVLKKRDTPAGKRYNVVESTQAYIQYLRDKAAGRNDALAYTGSNLPAARRISARWPEKTCHPAGRVRQ